MKNCPAEATRAMINSGIKNYFKILSFCLGVNSKLSEYEQVCTIQCECQISSTNRLHDEEKRNYRDVNYMRNKSIETQSQCFS